jgi:hypothetical protein
MKILLVGMPTTFDYLVTPLTEAGHTVRLIDGTGQDFSLLTNATLAKDYILEQITAFVPDMVVNAITPVVLPVSSDYTYVGNTAASAKLETHKWETRTKAGELGWSLPTVLEECNMNAVSNYDKTVYVKPKGDCQLRQIFKVPASTNNELHNLEMTADAGYVEDSVDYEVEAWCFFTISNGSYSIIRTLGCTGYGDDKLVDSTGDWRQGDITLVDLTDAQRAAFITKCEAWLDYAVTLGGNYEGTLGGAITDDNTVYWFEQNSRPGTYNIGMLPGTVQDWIDGLTTDSTKSVNQITAATIRSEKGFG